MGPFGFAVCCLALLTICTADTVPDRRDGVVTPLFDYAVRLADGPDQTQGRYELSIGGQWGTVCDVGFADIDAQVACVSLGFTGGTFLGNTFGPGTGGVYFSDVACVGTEQVIDDCPHPPLGTVGNCTHANDVSISCTGAGGYPVRLAGGVQTYEGRLEIQYQGVWGTVCDDFFNVPDAQVACASLGFAREGYAVLNSFGQVTGPIHLDDVECVGDEASIGNCVHQPWTTHNCAHTEDVAVVCSSLDVAVRLVDGATANEGRLELFLGGAWGTVCDTGFRDVEAQVACNNLGFDAGQGTFLGNQFGPGTGNIYLDSVVCDGTEPILNECDHSPIGTTNCTHASDVSISCAGASYDVRLVGSVNAYEGRVEILYRGEWGTVCDDLFDVNDARVVCNTLGFGFQGYALGNEFGPGTGKIWLDEVDCAGTEPNIGSCAHNPWGVHNCLHSEDVSVSCTPPDVAVRLVGGATDNEGRIEAYVRNEWGTVCDSGFGATEAGVACTSLGFDEGQGTFLDNQFGPGSGRIFFDHVDCAGGEWSLNECQHSPIGATNCTHAGDVSISCVGNSYDLRLADGVFASDGRLEIFYRGAWGTVCDDLFTDAEAQVACSALGYGQGIGRFDGNNAGTGQIWLDSVQCLGWESNVGQCAHDAWGFNDCTHPEDVAISCSTSTGNMYPVRLIGSDGLQAQSSGRLEYSIGGSWGTVCDPTFSDVDAQVACYSLGFNQFEGSFIGQTHGSGTGNIWLDNVRCMGTEVMIDDCPHSVWGTVACDHTTDVSIQCVGPWPANPVRLVHATDNSTNPTEGRLEIQYYGTWGTVCNDGFAGNDAAVACASLGFGYIGSVLAGLPHGQGTGKIWLDDVSCSGSELNIGNCAHSPWGQHNCAHSEDVAIRCV